MRRKLRDAVKGLQREHDETLSGRKSEKNERSQEKHGSRQKPEQRKPTQVIKMNVLLF